LFSFNPGVSFLKVTSWVMVLLTSSLVWRDLSADDRTLLSRQLFWGLTIVLVVSIPILLIPQGFLRNGRGFQGVLAHPQTFGPFAAILGTWAVGKFLSQPRAGSYLLYLAVACLALSVLSQARTAVFSFILGV